MIEIKADWTIDELLAAYAGENEPLEGYYTTREWSEKLGICEDRVRSICRKADKQGQLLVARHPRRAIDGHMIPTQVYAFQRKESK